MSGMNTSRAVTEDVANRCGENCPVAPMASVTMLHPDRDEAVVRRRPASLMRSEAGMATAEYAIATLAAVGFAALLVAVLGSGEVRGLLMGLIQTALSFG